MAGGEMTGLMRHRITLERRDASRDALGRANGTWRPVARCWAAIASERNGPAITGDRVTSWPRYRVMLRRRDDVDAGCRVMWRGHAYRLLAVESDPQAPDRMRLLMERTA